jgi:hypothetical protein
MGRPTEALINATDLFTCSSDTSKDPQMGHRGCLKSPTPSTLNSSGILCSIKILSLVHVLLSHPQLNSTNQIRPKPVETDHVLIAEEALNAGGIEDTFHGEGVRQVPETAKHNELLLFVENPVLIGRLN